MKQRNSRLPLLLFGLLLCGSVLVIGLAKMQGAPRQTGDGGLFVLCVRAVDDAVEPGIAPGEGVLHRGQRHMLGRIQQVRRTPARSEAFNPRSGAVEPCILPHRYDLYLLVSTDQALPPLGQTLPIRTALFYGSGVVMDAGAMP